MAVEEGTIELGAPGSAERAHVLRRLTFGPFAGTVEASFDDHRTVGDLVESLVEADPVPFEAPMEIDGPLTKERQRALDLKSVEEYWFDRMGSDEAALHDRMMWFWHTLFTTHTGNSITVYLWKQLAMIHRHATGNYRELAKAYVLDPAMLGYLDGDLSSIDAPNENLSRELMELFMLGIGNYTEEDVRAGARSLSGWTVDPDIGHATFTPGNGPSEPDTFLGTTTVFTPHKVVDVILEQPTAGTHVVEKLWRYFIGGTPDPKLVGRWADAFRADDWELMPLLRRMLYSEEFLRSRRSRPRTGIEWLIPTARAASLGSLFDPGLALLEQTPFQPPSVAGWPGESRWVAPGLEFARLSYLRNHLTSAPGFAAGEDMADAALRWCGVYEVSETTLQTLESLVETLRTDEDLGLTSDEERQRMALLRMVLMTPEFSLA